MHYLSNFHSHSDAGRGLRLFTVVIALVSGMLLIPTSGAAAEKELYVQSQQAKLLAEARVDAALVTTLARGDAVQVIESNNAWHKVRAGKNEGWVFKYFLADHPPLGQTTLALSDDVDKEHARRRASAVVTAGATRGLNQQERDRASQMGIADYRGLARMEYMTIDANEVAEFVKEGIPQ